MKERQQIISLITRILEDKGADYPALNGDTIFLSGDLDFDSLDLAGLVSELEDLYGSSPFENGFVNFQTVDELAKLFATASNSND